MFGRAHCALRPRSRARSMLCRLVWAEFGLTLASTGSYQIRAESVGLSYRHLDLRSGYLGLKWGFWWFLARLGVREGFPGFGGLWSRSMRLEAFDAECTGKASSKVQEQDRTPKPSTLEHRG